MSPQKSQQESKSATKLGPAREKKKERQKQFNCMMEFIARIVCLVERVIVKLLNELQTDNQAFTYSVGVLKCYSTQFSQFWLFLDTICDCVYAFESMAGICSECDIEW